MSFPYPLNSSGLKTSTGQITNQSSFLGGIDMLSPTTGTATLTVYDSENSNTSGKLVLAEMEVDAGMPSCNHEYTNFVNANRGLYCSLDDLSGTASYIIRFALS